MVQEREQNPEGIIHYKTLKLIAPEFARELGYETESPVFVSPIIRQKHNCVICQTEYQPLVYQAGYTTKSQHYHGVTSGGVYFFSQIGNITPWQAVEVGVSFDGWLAVLEPDKSPNAYIKAIKSFCRGHDEEELDHGLVGFSVFNIEDRLYPVCERFVNEAEDRIYKYKYRFKIEDGNVLFSQI